MNNPLVQLGASYYTNNRASDAIKNATNAQLGANQQATNLLGQYYGNALGKLEGAYNEGRTSLLPYYTGGLEGLDTYQNILADPSQITNDPGYQFRLNQGLEAVDRRFGRMRNSGNRAIALNDYAQNYATTELDSALSRALPLMSAGQGATNTLADLGYNYAGGISNLMSNQGSNLANLAVSAGDVAGAGQYGQAQIDRNLFGDILDMTSRWDDIVKAKKS